MHFQLIPKKTATLLIGSSLLAGCTSLDVVRIDPAKPETRAGLPYSIPMTQYEIQLEYKVANCEPSAEIAVTAKVVETHGIPDPAHRYMIDPNSLSSPVKTSLVKLEYHENGLVKSLNAEAEDKTGEIVTNVGLMVVKIAKLAGGVGSESQAVPPPLCTDQVKTALKELKKLGPRLKKASNDLKTAEVGLKSIKKKIEQLGVNVDENTKSQLAQAQENLLVAIANQAEVLQEVEQFTMKVAYKETKFWPTDSSDFDEMYVASTEKISSWLITSFDDDPAKSPLTVHLDLQPLHTDIDVVKNGNKYPNVGSKSLGIPLRSPQVGFLRICSKAKCGDPRAELLFSKKDPVHQLGFLYFLPCKSKAFTSMTCGFELAESGRLKSIGVSQKKAVLEEITKTTDNLLGSAGEARTALKSDPLQEKKDKTAILVAEAEYRAALNALAENPLAVGQNEFAALKLQVDIAEARLSLKKAMESLQD